MSKYSKLLFQTTPSKLSEEQIKQVEEYIDLHKNDYRKSDAAKLKAKERMLKQWQDDEYRENQSKKLKAFYSSEENKAKTSERNKNAWEGDAARKEKQSNLMISLNKQRFSNCGITAGEIEREKLLSKNSINHLSRKLFNKSYPELNKEEVEKVIELAKPYSKSYVEIEIYNWIKEIYSGEVIRNNRTVLDGKELDIYIPEKKLALE